MTSFETVLASTEAFKERLKTIKVEGVGFPWYPYDTMSNFHYLARLSVPEVENIFTGKSRFADIGGADGDLSFFLESLGHDCDIYDFSPTNMNYLKGAKYIKNAIGSAVGIYDRDLDSQFQFEGGYDLIFLLGILYHLKNPFYVLEHLAQRSRYLFLSTRIARYFKQGAPDCSGYAAAYLVSPTEANNDATNYWVFTGEGLKRIVDRSGWDILSFVTVGDTRNSNPQDPGNDERAFCLLRSRR